MSKSKKIVKEKVESEMVKKLREFFGQNLPEEIIEEEKPILPPLEEAIERALYSLNEISIFAQYDRSAECSREAREAIDIIKELKIKYDEQNKIMEVLSTPAEELRENE